MYFYLSKTLGELIFPSTFILLVIVCGLLLWRSRVAWLGRRLTVIGLVLLLIACLTPLGTVLIVPLENRFPPWDETRGPPTGIVVLGGVVSTYLSLSRKNISLGAASGRLIAAVELQRRYPALRIVFSGGNSNLIFKGRSESDFAAQFLENMGVPKANVTVDNSARNTEENAVNAKKIANPKLGERWLLVTSALHMPRAMGLFRAAGFSIEAYPVDYTTGGWHDVLALPSVSLLAGFGRLDPATHEWAGLLVDRIMGRSLTLFPGLGPAASDR